MQVINGLADILKYPKTKDSDRLIKELVEKYWVKEEGEPEFERETERQQETE
jgi:hypothetical protein